MSLRPDPQVDVAMKYLDALPISDGGHPADNIERAARVCRVSVEAIRKRLNARRGW